MNTAIRNFSMTDLKKDPESYVGKLFVFGGIIADTKATAEGSLIEAVYVPVDSRGHLKETGPYQVRFLALYPRNSGLLDPMIYRREKQITIAAEFLGTREGKIDEMEYTYPFFRIKDIYHWEEPKVYYYPYYYVPSHWWLGWDFPYWWGYWAPPPW